MVEGHRGTRVVEVDRRAQLVDGDRARLVEGDRDLVAGLNAGDRAGRAQRPPGGG